MIKPLIGISAYDYKIVGKALNKDKKENRFRIA